MSEIYNILVKKCSKCGETKDRSEFPPRAKNRDGLHGRCRECINQATYASRRRAQERGCCPVHTTIPVAPGRMQCQECLDWHSTHNFVKKYGITEEIYQQMFARQNGRCAICNGTDPGQGKTRLSIDHCHKTGIVRGLLCSNCNTAIGQFNENRATLVAAIGYLKFHQQNNQ